MITEREYNQPSKDLVKLVAKDLTMPKEEVDKLPDFIPEKAPIIIKDK
jgi:hypothetical protein